MRGVWPFAVAIAVRLGLWLVIPSSRFASDEDSYVRAGTQLLITGQQDLFWPPGTGWLIAAIGSLTPSPDIRVIRLAWILMDLVCLAAVRVLARRAARGVVQTEGRARQLGDVAAFAYALYLPAISFSQFATSEMPALLLVLSTLLLLTSTDARAMHYIAAGVCTGFLCVTRPSLMPLLVFLPGAVMMWQRSRETVQRAALLVATGAAVIAAVVLRNAVIAGQPTIAQNSAYNLYIGNRELYAEDLDLFHPVATPGQIEFRRQYFADQLTYPTQPPEQLQQEAMEWIATHPGTFARRALGRLARVFAPKTDVLELLGGERAAGIFSARSLTLLAAANLQWAGVLFAGIAGLAALRRRNPRVGNLFVATVVGSLPLCLVAISKPRYAFTFEPLLLIGATMFLTARASLWAALPRRDRVVVIGCALFIVWGWVAWLTFAITSRVALASGS